LQEHKQELAKIDTEVTKLDAEMERVYTNYETELNSVWAQVGKILGSLVKDPTATSS
jgi:hypothetical protein